VIRISEHESKNWLEWTVFAVGCVLVLTVVGVLGYEIWHDTPREPAQLEVELGRPEKQGRYYAVPVFVSNRGDETAENVRVEVTLETEGGEQHSSEFDIQFLPQQATEQGFALFETDPAKAKSISARPLGYRQP